MNRRPGPLIAAAAALWIVLAAAAGPAHGQEDARPEQLIRRLNAALLEAMKNAKTLGFEGRYRLLAPVVGEVFHLSAMARFTAGAHWRRFTEGQRRRFVDVFTRMSTTTFAKRFSGYSGERFEVTGTRPGLRGAVIVESRLVRPSGKSVPIDYLLRRFEGRWRVVDVFLDAKYSELALRRSEYGAVLRRGGADTLIRRLEEKIASTRARAEAS